jgi:excisionase family DNA binding protein
MRLPLIFTITEAAAYYSISRASVYRALFRGEISSVKIGKFRRVVMK